MVRPKFREASKIVRREDDMSIFDALIHGFYKTVVHTVMMPLRDQAFAGTRKAKISSTEKEALASGSVGF